LKPSSDEVMQIFKDWRDAFPELAKWRSNKLVKRVGPVLLGIEINRIFPTTYRPEFVLFNLLDESYPQPTEAIRQFIRGRNNIQITIPLKHHTIMFPDVVEAMKQQAYINLSTSPSLKHIIESVFKFLEEDLPQGVNNYGECKSIMMLSHFIEETELNEEFFAKAVQHLEEVPKDLLEEMTHGYAGWLQRMKGLEKTELLAALARNIAKYKLQSVPYTDPQP
jgi:hypothetical protein